jgi:HAD superfamily hydrolase (TIGR01450 family)
MTSAGMTSARVTSARMIAGRTGPETTSARATGAGTTAARMSGAGMTGAGATGSGRMPVAVTDRSAADRTGIARTATVRAATAAGTTARRPPGWRGADRGRPGQQRRREIAATTSFAEEPPLTEEITPGQLDAEVRRDLRGLQKDTAEKVARHLVAAGSLVDVDPERALEHARYARRRASRIAAVREAAGIAAYHAGEWSEALGELRAARRMGGGPGHLAVMADIERALGRPERALDLTRGPEARELDRAETIELAIVAAGARRDLGELDAAVVGLQIDELDPARREPWSARLFYAYADNLLAVGRQDEALQWFVHAADVDDDADTDAAQRIAELTGEALPDDGIEFGLESDDDLTDKADVDDASGDADEAGVDDEGAEGLVGETDDGAGRDDLEGDADAGATDDDIADQGADGLGGIDGAARQEDLEDEADQDGAEGRGESGGDVADDAELTDVAGPVSRGRRRHRPGGAGPVSDMLDRFDALLADLDGTLYRGPVAVPGAVEAVAAAGGRGVRTAYVTNNASRRPEDVAAHLAEMGFPATPDDVVTSSQAAAALLAGQLPAGATVLIVGTDALAAEVAAVGLGTTREADGAVAVVQGHSPDTGWRILAEATVALRAGAVWVACNLDPTLPTERGPLPGNGSMVAVLRIASGREPQVAGKPGPALLEEAARRAGAAAPLMIGDRLDTDIEGGRAAGMATLMVMTGVSTAADVLAAPPRQRPDFIAADMSGLTADPDDLAPGPRPGWDVSVDGDGELTLDGAGDPLDALRALCGAHWAAGGGAASVTSAGAESERVVKDLGLSADPSGSATVDSAGSPPERHR